MTMHNWLSRSFVSHSVSSAPSSSDEEKQRAMEAERKRMEKVEQARMRFGGPFAHERGVDLDSKAGSVFDAVDADEGTELMGVFTNMMLGKQAQAPANPTPTQLSYPQSNYDPYANQATSTVGMDATRAGISLRVTKIKNGYLVSTGRYEGDLLQHYYAEDLKAVGEYVTAYCVEQELSK